MKRPSFGEAKMGALAGAVVAAIGGLFAVGVAPAILARNPALLFGTPILGLICFLVSGPFGWLIGGQIGPRIGQKLDRPSAEMFGGALGGMVPVLVIAAWGWYMVMPR